MKIGNDTNALLRGYFFKYVWHGFLDADAAEIAAVLASEHELLSTIGAVEWRRLPVTIEIAIAMCQFGRETELQPFFKRLRNARLDQAMAASENFANDALDDDERKKMHEIMLPSLSAAQRSLHDALVDFLLLRAKALRERAANAVDLVQQRYDSMLTARVARDAAAEHESDDDDDNEIADDANAAPAVAGTSHSLFALVQKVQFCSLNFYFNLFYHFMFF
jgi:hypothetical protein